MKPPSLHVSFVIIQVAIPSDPLSNVVGANKQYLYIHSPYNVIWTVCYLCNTLSAQGSSNLIPNVI